MKDVKRIDVSVITTGPRSKVETAKTEGGSMRETWGMKNGKKREGKQR